MMLRIGAALVVAVATAVGPIGAPQTPASRADDLLARRYQEGEGLHYLMQTSNRGRADTLTYTITADATVKRDADGRFFEEIAWRDLAVNGAPFALPPTSQAFRQLLTLEPNPQYAQVPDLRKVHPILIGPITDLLTFYADLFVARQGHLAKAGDHFRFAHGTPASWADGEHVILGEDSIDFDVTLAGVDRAAGTYSRHPSCPRYLAASNQGARRVDAATGGRHAEQLGAGRAHGGRQVHGRYRAGDLRRDGEAEPGRRAPPRRDPREPRPGARAGLSTRRRSHCGPSSRYDIRRHVEITATR